MISLTIKATKNFMSQLLVKDTFDNWLICEANILTGCTVTIDGSVNKAFYTTEELEKINEAYSFWKNLKPFCFSLIKGNKVPVAMKFVFSLNSDSVKELLSSADTRICTDDISGAFINIKYSDDKINIITGTSLKIFTLDKIFEKTFDNYVKTFLDNAGIEYEE